MYGFVVFADTLKTSVCYCEIKSEGIENYKHHYCEFKKLVQLWNNIKHRVFWLPLSYILFKN